MLNLDIGICAHQRRRCKMTPDQADLEDQRSLTGRRGCLLAAVLVLMAGVGLGFLAWECMRSEALDFSSY